MIDPVKIGGWVTLLVAAGLMAGCATLIDGNQQAITVTTSPPGAACTLDREGSRIGVVMETPALVPVEKSKRELVVTCRKAGYQTLAAIVRPRPLDLAFYDLVSFGPIGLVWDAAASSNYTYPGEVVLPLTASSTYTPRPTGPYRPGARSTFTIPFVEAAP